MFVEKRDFLSGRAYEALLEFRKAADFGTFDCPEDGQAYEGIAAGVPEIVRREVEFGVGMLSRKLFLRDRPEGGQVHQHVHSDALMGRKVLIYYLNDGPRFSGTAFMRHALLGVCHAAAVEEIARICQEDENRLDVWAEMAFVREEANKALIFDSGYFHLAKPVDGYGMGVGARCVLTGFF